MPKYFFNKKGLFMNEQYFNKFYTELIMYFQLIENDLKTIYSYLHIGAPLNNFHSVNKNTLGRIIKVLKELDHSDKKPILSYRDYNYLSQMSQKINYWCHEAFLHFIYQKDSYQSRAYYEVTQKLKKDHDRISILGENVEQLRVAVVKNWKR